MFDHKDTLFHIASQLQRRLANRLREALLPHGLHPAQYTALAEIAEREGLTQAELVARLDLEQPGVARTLSALEADGWIERSSLGKGRAQGLYLSDKARAVLPTATVTVAEINHQALAGLSRTEAAHLLDDLNQLSDANRAG